METALNHKILKWWKLLPDNLKGNMPTFIHPLNKNAQILFVGLNPSGKTEQQAAIEYISENDIQTKISEEQIAIFGEGKDRKNQYKRYYKPITDIADELDLEFEHCDLFQMSYRTAKIVVRELIGTDGLLKEMHNNHLQVFKEIFDYISPKVLITNNVVSANILKGYFHLLFDNKTGLYTDKNGVYFYLNGIMSYGRQTVYDKERMIWIIRNIL
jgi:hypothetical protein